MYSSPPGPKPRHKPRSEPRKGPLSIAEPPDNLFPSRGECLRLVAVVLISVVVAYTCNSIATYFTSPAPTKKSFCDTQLLDSLDSPPDFCEPCPEHGECYEGGLECARGYKKLGGACVEDQAIDERAKKLLQWVENHLCGSYAQFLCYGTGKIWVQEKDIWKDVDRQKLLDIVGADEASFLYTKNRTVDTIGKSLDMRTNTEGIKEFKCPELLVQLYKPLSCRARQWISKRVAIIVPACMMVMVALLLFSKVRRSWHLENRAERLYQQICDILEENAVASRGVDGQHEPWIVASRLRDHLLVPKERKQPVLWNKVEELVQEDSRIDVYPKLVKGESRVVWEWQVEGSFSSERHRKKGGEVRKFNSLDGSEVTRQRQLHHALQTEAKTPML